MLQVNAKVHCEPWMIMLCQCRLIMVEKKSIILVNEVNNGGGYA